MNLPPFATKLLTDYFRFTAIGVAVIVIVAGYTTFVTSRIQSLQESGFLRRQQVSADLERQKQNAENLKKTNENFARAFPGDSLQVVDTFLPTSDDFPGLLLTVEDLARQVGLQLSSISVSEVGTAAGPDAPAAAAGAVTVNTQDINVSTSGGQSYQEFKNFIAAIESSRRLFDVVSLGYGAGDSKSGRTYTLVLRTYYVPAVTK